jgi:hypothetical protein
VCYGLALFFGQVFKPDYGDQGQMKKELKIFDKPENVKRLLYIFYASLVVLLIADFFIHKHADFPWEGAPEFFAVYGFVSCVALIFIAKILRKIVKRKENYYD